MLKRPKFFILAIIFLALSQNSIVFAQREKSPPKITKVEVFKAARTLKLLSNSKEVHTFKVALGGNPIGHKRFERDQKTPEGTYTIDWKNAKSSFYKSLHISYPNKKDREYAKKHKKSAGGDIFIHGIGKMNFVGKHHTLIDWTLGCVAVTNEEIDLIWDLVAPGTPIEIFP